MKQFVIIGIQDFGFYLLEELSRLGYEVIALDQSESLIERAKDYAVEAYVVYEYTRDTLDKIIPKNVEAVIVSLSHEFTEQAIVVVSYLKSLNINRIIAKVEKEIYADILKQLGVSRTILPDKEAVQKITPLLTNPLISAYNLLGYQMVAAELIIPQEYIGKTIAELNLRQKKGINVIAIKYSEKNEFDFSFDIAYSFHEGDEIFIYGKEDNMSKFSEEIRDLAPAEEDKNVWARRIFRVFKHK